MVQHEPLTSLFPDLMGGLPERTVRRVRAVVGSARQEGYRPQRWEIALLIAVDRGEVDHDEALAAVRDEFQPVPDGAPAEFHDWPSYLYPGTRVLVNHMGLREAHALHTAEARLTCLRTHQLLTRRGPVDLDGPPSAALRQIHRQLFQDVFRWAGQDRTVSIERNGPFAPLRSMAQVADLAADLAHRPDLGRRSPAGLARDLARIYQAINHAHLFREGNGRAGKTYLALIADRACFDLDFDAVPAHAWVRASQTCRPVDESWPDPTDLEALFRSRILLARDRR